jgi:glutamine cyclotransferase
MRFLLILLTLAFTFGCSGVANTPKANINAASKPSPLPVYGYEIVKTYPHDPKAFTEGLFFHDGFLYESTGEEGRSSLRKVDLETGKVVQKWNLPPEDFGEGISMIGDKIYMLTWQGGLGRVLDSKTFKLLKEFHYQGEGWGMTTDGSALYMTQGTHLIKVLNPETFNVAQTLAVMREDGKPLFLLNELEFIKGELWANIWHSEQTETNTTQGVLPNISKPNYVARIDAASGKLLGWVDLANISPQDQSGKGQDENTLNGIAYDQAKDRIFVTGKNWKNLYEIKIKTPPGQ